MMSKRHTFTATLAWGGDIQTGEAEVECSYTVSWGAPARGPSYACGGTPADPSDIEDVRILTVDGKPWPVDLTGGNYMTYAQQHDMLEEKLVDECWDEMIENAIEHEAAA
jgi:hypothetical protein